MPTDFNTSHAQRAIREFNIRNGDFFDNRLPNTLTPVIPLTPIVNLVRHLNKSNTGSTGIYTTPADKDFYLTSAYLSGTADATADNLSYTITATIDGVARDIIKIGKQTTTAGSEQVAQSFFFPIKIDRGTAISLTTTFTVGTTIMAATITGYLADTLA